MAIEDKISFFLEMMSCCNTVCYWCFDKDFTLLRNEGNLGESFIQSFLSKDDRFASIVAHSESSDMPLISSVALGLEWASVIEKEDGALKRIHILGPLFLSDISPQTITTFVSGVKISQSQRQKVIKKLFDLPIIPMTQFYPFVQMLHYCVTGNKIVFSDIVHESEIKKPGQDFEDSLKNTANRHAGIYAAERELMRMIEEGNTDYHSALNTAALRATYTNQSSIDDPVRKAQFVGVTFITLCSRAAIRGGLPPATAYALGNRYEAELPKLIHVSSMAALLNTMYEDFILRVHKCKENPMISRPIQTCCDYIHMHVADEIDLKELAAQVGYTEYYLSRKFKKEVGMSIWDYNNRAKVERAKTMLIDPEQTIQSISDSLGYCSRPYFSEVFQQCEGMPPSEYRRIHLKM